jgi:hypothetical protein
LTKKFDKADLDYDGFKNYLGELIDEKKLQEENLRKIRQQTVTAANFDAEVERRVEARMRDLVTSNATASDTVMTIMDVDGGSGTS